jgi:outer membrane lipoprotein SlyB
MYTALTVLVAANLSGCGDNEPTSGKVLPVAPAASSALTAERLQNVSYTGILESPVTLTDGRFEGAPGNHARGTIRARYDNHGPGFKLMETHNVDQ